MRFSLREIECDNAAFGEDTEDAMREVAAVLRRVAAQLEQGETSGKVRDSNGNTVSDFGFSTLIKHPRRVYMTHQEGR